MIPVEALPAFDTLQEAGVYGIVRSYLCSPYYECGGIIIRRLGDGKYVVGPVHTDYSGDSLEQDHHVPPGYVLVADFHTHPCLPQSHSVSYFSPQDISGNLAEHTIGFMGDLCSGDVHEFDPLKDRPADEPVPGTPGIYSTRGRVIGHVQITRVSLEADQGV